MQYIKLEMGYLSMKANNKKLIKLLGTLGILESEEIKDNNIKTEDDVTYTVSNIAGTESIEYRILSDKIDEETVALLLEAEKLKTLRSIQKMLKFFTILTIVTLVCAFLFSAING